MPCSHLASFGLQAQRFAVKFGNYFEIFQGHIDIVDHEGHDYGPDSPELLQLLKLLDNTLSHFMDELGSKGLDSGVNMILVSDHGMTYIGPGSGLKEIHIPQIVGQEEADHFVDLKWSRMWFGLPKAKVLPVRAHERLAKDLALHYFVCWMFLGLRAT